MKHIRLIVPSAVIALLVVGNAAASSVKFQNMVSQILSPVCTVNINNVNCGNPINANLCGPGYKDNYANDLWGYGQPNMTWYINGSLSGPDGVYVPLPSIGSEDPKNVANVTFFKNPDTTPIDNFFGVGPISFYVVPVCVHVEQDDQGAKLAVIRMVARLTLAPGFVVEEPELWLITQDQNGQDRIAISAAAKGDLTTCIREDARNSLTNPEGVGLPPNPPGYTTDHLFELLSPITSGNITPKK